MKTTTILSNVKTLLIAGAIIGSTTLMADGATLYKKCASCHGSTGQKQAMNMSKIINTMSEADIATAINGYKDGTYGGKMKGLMKGQVSRLDAGEVKELSKYIAGLK